MPFAPPPPPPAITLPDARIANTAADTAAARHAAEALIRRILPVRAGSFRVEMIPAEKNADVFVLESQGGKIVLRGSSPIAIASALNWYLKYDCHCQLSWDGDNLALPKTLPPVAQPVRKVTPYARRVYLNYCTFSYSMAWWDWRRWQREIDWMALHGINTPLAATGQEAVWEATLRHYRMSDDEIRHFLVGPGFFAWQWMTNIEGYQGPLPQHWIDSHLTLGRQILARERELGMTPILQGFTGCIPTALITKYPSARIQKKPLWCAVPPGTAQLDPLDPLFAEMGQTFLEEQTKLLGTDHLYAADPFHEGSPPVSGNAYLTSVGKAISDLTVSVDPKATIVMQTWSVREPIVKGIPPDRLLLLDLTGDYWKRHQSYWGYPWVAGIIHNYGGKALLGGGLAYSARNAALLRADPAAGNLVGIGLFPEAIEQNPVIYEAAIENTWHDTPIDLDTWLPAYVMARYGQGDPDAQEAWRLLRATVYSVPANHYSAICPICCRPALTVHGWDDGTRAYPLRDVWPALDYLLKAGDRLGDRSTYRYDVTDLTRQVLADLSLPLQKRIAADYRAGDPRALAADSAQFLDLMDDMDTLLATRPEFLLGKWLSDARSWGRTNAEKRQYEENARTQITVWGPDVPGAMLFDYSARQWSGLIRGYYKPRWQRFLTYLQHQPAGADRFTDAGLPATYGGPTNQANDFYQELSAWEYAWCKGTEPYPAVPAGDSLTVARRLYAKWLPVAQNLETSTVASNATYAP